MQLAGAMLDISTSPGSSSGGSVSGGHARLVTPPATAASISDSSVALYSPGRVRAPTGRPTRRNDQAGGVDCLFDVKIFRRGADRDNPFIGDKQIRHPIQTGGRADQAAILISIFMYALPPALAIAGENGHHGHSRTAIPNVTCGRITDCAPSATADRFPPRGSSGRGASRLRFRLACPACPASGRNT